MGRPVTQVSIWALIFGIHRRLQEVRCKLLIYDHNPPNFTKLQLHDSIELLIKNESRNPTGSIKYKTAKNLLDRAEQHGQIKPGWRVIESSSGNLGIALAALCAERGYRFTCVVDPNASGQSLAMIRAHGAQIHQVQERDFNGGYLGTRIAHVQRYVSENENVYWTNQYSNPANPEAHFLYTAKEIEQYAPNIGLLAVGAGTTGTLMGCSNYFGDRIKILAVDSIGSITFGGRPGERHVPGLGTSRRPPIFRRSDWWEFEAVPEREGILMCRWLAQKFGYLAGGSTGIVLAGLVRRPDLWTSEGTIVAISPDGGEKYLDTIYNDDWVTTKFGAGILEPKDEYPEPAILKI